MLIAAATAGPASAAPAVLGQAAGELVVRVVGGLPQSGGELLAVLFCQQAVERGEEDRAVREPQRAGDDCGHEVVVVRPGRLGDRGGDRGGPGLPSDGQALL